MKEQSLLPRINRWVRGLLGFLRNVPNDRVTSVLINQLVRSGTSVGANYAEAQYGSSRRDFGNFLRHALKSARESEYWLELLSQDVISNSQTTLVRLREELNQIVRMLCVITKKIMTSETNNKSSPSEPVN